MNAASRRAHPRIAVNTLSLEPAPFQAHVDQIARLGVAMLTPVVREIHACGASAAAAAIGDAGLAVAALTHGGFTFADKAGAAAGRDQLDRTIEVAAAIGSPAISMTTGGRGELSWPQAALRFAEEVAPCVDRARAAGVALAIEPVSHLYAGISIVHRLSDVVSVARRAGINLGIDLFPCWVDSDIDEAIVAAAPLCSFVQVSDFVQGDQTLPCRAVLGDGALPLDRLVSQIIRAGFKGPFDIEILGPRLAAEGHEAGLRRSIAKLESLIEAAEAARPG